MTEMTDNNCFDVEKYQNALSDLCCGDYTYIRGDPAVDAIVELIDIAVEQDVIIKRQQAEIERLRAECETQSVLWRNHFESIYESAKETVKSEAIKEFAARLKEVGIPVTGERGYEGVFVLATNIQIDDLVKEMVGGEQ